MFIQRVGSFKSNSKWKFISLGNDIYLVNEFDKRKPIKVLKRLKCLQEIPFEGVVEDLEIFVIDDGFIFKFYDDIYEIKNANEIDYTNLIDYDYNKDDVILYVIHNDRLSFLTFWYDEKSSSETFQELSTIDFSSIPSAKNLSRFIDKIAYIEGNFYYKNEDGDTLLIRFNSEKIDTYEVPSSTIFCIDDKYEKSLYATFDNCLIDIIHFKMYDISDINTLYGDKLNDFGISIFQLQDSSMDFIFWYENKNAFDINLVVDGNFKEVKGLLYCYSLKQFVFYDPIKHKNPELQTFLLYDYTVPNIVKSKSGFKLFYVDHNLNIKYMHLSSDTKILTNLDCNKNGIFWHKVIFTKMSSNCGIEKKDTIIINNSVFLSKIINYSTLGQLIYMDYEEDAIKFIISKQFDRHIAAKIRIPHSNNKLIHYLYVDDCCTIETPLSEYGKYTLLIPRDGSKLDFKLSFNSFKKFILNRRINNGTWYEHLIIKCLYTNSDGIEKIAYIDVTNLEIVPFEDLIEDAYNYE